MEPFWYNDFSVLYNPAYLTRFFPSEALSYASKLNAVVRCAFYFTVLMYFYKGNNVSQSVVVGVPLLALGVTFYLWQTPGAAKEKENFNGSAANNNLVPTFNNPFMNPNLIVQDPKTFLTPQSQSKTVRFDINHHIDTKEDVQTKQEVDDKFNARLYTSIGDIFTNENSQRQFYHVPSRTYPNDQASFAQWCYGVDKSCKSGDNTACQQYNDELRGHADARDIRDPGPTQIPTQTNWF